MDINSFLNKTINLTARIRILFLLFLFTVLSIILIGTDIVKNYLNTNIPLETDLLILEGWLSSKYYSDVLAIYHEHDYKKILITGKPTTPPIYISVNGYIILKNLVNTTTAGNITAELEGSYAEGEYTRCRVFKNDSLITSLECIKKQYIEFLCQLNKSDSIVFEFFNDACEGTDDRNLYLNNFNINTSQIKLNNLDIWLSTKNNYRPANYTSDSERLATDLINIGIPRERISYQVNEQHGISKTYNNASTCVKWMNTHNYKSGNIVTPSFHSKRTYFSYKKANSTLNFGVIPIEEDPSRLRALKELLGNPLLRITPRFILDVNFRNYKD